MNTVTHPSESHKTACILCSINCGLTVQTEGRTIRKILPDNDHPGSKGYLCEKAQRLDYYQNGADRLTSPMRRRPDGGYEAISWDVAIREVADKFKAIRAQHGEQSVIYYGGGGQGNHLGGMYADAFLNTLGKPWRSNALAQEKTGEFWVQGKMFTCGTHPDFEHCDVALFIGKNPWQSHGFARARIILKDIQKDPARTIIVIDPRRSETAAMADYHLAIKPGTDAWCLAALLGIIVQDKLLASDWLAAHTTGLAELMPHLQHIPVTKYAAHCGVGEALLRDVAGVIARAKSVAAMEDLGIQMNRHSTLNSYLQRLVWLLCGHYGAPGTAHPLLPFLSLSAVSKGEPAGKRQPNKTERRSPVANAKIIIGLVPCNVIAEEILSEHPKRYRAMLVQSGNPAHSIADSQKFREAMRALELSVVVDVAMTETARQADYVLPACSQFEKAEATFFNLEYPGNVFHLRAPLFAPLAGTLPEAEIYARLTEAMGQTSEADYAPLRRALRLGKTAFALAFFATAARKPTLMKYAPVILYRVLGASLPEGMASAAALWGVAQLFVRANRDAAARAGFGGLSIWAGEKLFRAILTRRSGTVFGIANEHATWANIRHPEQRIALAIPELFAELDSLAEGPPAMASDFPFVLCAGERRTETANTAIRNAAWHRKGQLGALRISPHDAAAIQCADGEMVRLSTRRSSVTVPIEISEGLQNGHLSLPNGLGIDYANSPNGASPQRRGIAPNELTDLHDRDFLAGTPWHKFVPARVERIASM
jgi:anaerobic selenocysteine-containing dehydrogenase